MFHKIGTVYKTFINHFEIFTVRRIYRHTDTQISVDLNIADYQAGVSTYDLHRPPDISTLRSSLSSEGSLMPERHCRTSYTFDRTLFALMAHMSMAQELKNFKMSRARNKVVDHNDF